MATKAKTKAITAEDVERARIEGVLGMFAEMLQWQGCHDLLSDDDGALDRIAAATRVPFAAFVLERSRTFTRSCGTITVADLAELDANAVAKAVVVQRAAFDVHDRDETVEEG